VPSNKLVFEEAANSEERPETARGSRVQAVFARGETDREGGVRLHRMTGGHGSLHRVADRVYAEQSLEPLASRSCGTRHDVSLL
jgi:hypothetical protein